MYTNHYVLISLTVFFYFHAFLRESLIQSGFPTFKRTKIKRPTPKTCFFCSEELMSLNPRRMTRYLDVRGRKLGWLVGKWHISPTLWTGVVDWVVITHWSSPFTNFLGHPSTSPPRKEHGESVSVYFVAKNDWIGCLLFTCPTVFVC